MVSRADSRGLTLEWTQQDIADRLVGTLHGAPAKDESETLRLVIVLPWRPQLKVWGKSRLENPA